MIVGFCIVIEKVNEYLVIVDKTTCDKWIWKRVKRHRRPVKPKHLVEFDLLALDILSTPLFFAEYSHPEFSVVHKTCSELRAIGVLNTCFYLNVGISFSSKLFKKGPLLGVDFVLRDV
jgi:hypothetical protein